MVKCVTGTGRHSKYDILVVSILILYLQLGWGHCIFTLHNFRYVEGKSRQQSLCHLASESFVSPLLLQISNVYGPDDYILGAIDLYLVG